MTTCYMLYCHVQIIMFDMLHPAVYHSRQYVVSIMEEAEASMKAAIEEIQDKKEGPTVCLSIIMCKPPCSTWPILTFVSIHVVGDL